MSDLRVSVIIPSYNSRGTIAACLGAFRAQESRHRFEVVVVDSSTDGTPEIIREEFPEVSLYTSVDRKYPGDARNLGVLESLGEILAFTDSDCIVETDWIEKIVRAHEDPAPVIGGVIDNGNPGSVVGWGHYFSEFSQWMPQSVARHMDDVPGGCLSIKRWAFAEYGPFPEGTFSEDTLLNWRLTEASERPVFSPDIRVRHINQTSLWRLLKKQVMHGKCFAVIRVSAEEMSWRRRGLFAALAPMLPLVLFPRVCGRVLRNGTYGRQLVVSSPFVLLSLIGWSLGESLGYSGSGSARPLAG